MFLGFHNKTKKKKIIAIKVFTITIHYSSIEKVAIVKVNFINSSIFVYEKIFLFL